MPFSVILELRFREIWEDEITMSWCRIELFGGLRVHINGGLITRFRTRKTASLLAYLAYHLDRMHPRELLVDMFWVDSKPEQGRNSLSKAISSLRQQLSFPMGRKESIIYADRFYVGLRSEFVSTDVADFEANLKMARSTRSIPERIFHLAEAVKVYRGSLLPEFYDDWIEPERLRLSEQFEATVEELANFHERAGNLIQALHYARLASTVEPLSETACERIMKLLLAINQPSEALREFRAFSQRLKEQFGDDAFVLSNRLCSLAEQAKDQLNQLPKRTKFSSVSSVNACAYQKFPPCLGTVTLLTIVWKPCKNGQDPEKTLRDLIECYSGQIFNVEGNFLSGTFSCAYWAAECATNCRSRLGKCFVRCFLDTVDLVSEDSLPRALEQAKKLLLGAVKDGEVICSETTASLLRRNENFPVNLQKAKSSPSNLVKLFLVDGLNPTNGMKGTNTLETNLPPLTTCFFGRSKELEQLDQWLLKERTKLVALVGLGGSGKTRLALEFGHKVVSHYQGAVFFVPLQEAKEAAKIGEVLAKALGLRLLNGEDPLDTVVQMLRKRRCLLIWDGFEQVLPEGIEILCNVMNRLPMAQNLVTSRCPLKLPQERILPVLPLLSPKNLAHEDDFDLDAISQFPSVQMFVDRARAVCPDFGLTKKTAGSIAEICSHLEGFPLSIELAASWLSHLSLSQISEKLKYRLDFLKTRSRNIPRRHQSVRTVLMMTWELLPKNLKQALACLSVFRGGATIDALQEVTGTADINEAVSQLKNWGLVYSIERKGIERRLTMLDTVSEFILETVERNVLENLRYRHSRFFVSLAEKFAEDKDRNEKEWAKWFRRMEAERENLRSALEWSMKNEPQTALQLMRALTKFWSILGTFQEAYRWAYQFLACIPPESVDLRARALALTGYWAAKIGDYEQAQQMCESALRLHEQSLDELGQAETHLLLADIAFLKGDYIVANRHAKLSLDKYRAKGEIEGEAHATSTLGLISFRRSDIQSSKRYYERAFKLWKFLGKRLQIEEVRIGLANIAWRQGDFAKAYRLYEKALKFWSVVNPMKVAGILTDWGLLALSIGDYESAQKHYEAALKIRKEWGDLLGVGAALNGLASVAWRKGNLDEAQKLFSEALSIFQSIGNRWCIALTLTDLGNLALLRGNNELARSLLSQSLQVWRDLSDRWGIANTLRKLAVSEARCNNFQEALRNLQESLRFCESVGDKLGVVEAIEALAEILHQIGNYSLSVRLISVAWNLRLRIGTPIPDVKREQLNNLLNELREKLGRSHFETKWRQWRKIN